MRFPAQEERDVETDAGRGRWRGRGGGGGRRGSSPRGLAQDRGRSRSRGSESEHARGRPALRREARGASDLRRGPSWRRGNNTPTVPPPTVSSETSRSPSTGDESNSALPQKPVDGKGPNRYNTLSNSWAATAREEVRNRGIDGDEDGWVTVAKRKAFRGVGRGRGRGT